MAESCHASTTAANAAANRSGLWACLAASRCARVRPAVRRPPPPPDWTRRPPARSGRPPRAGRPGPGPGAPRVALAQVLQVCLGPEALVSPVSACRLRTITRCAWDSAIAARNPGSTKCGSTEVKPRAGAQHDQVGLRDGRQGTPGTPGAPPGSSQMSRTRESLWAIWPVRAPPSTPSRRTVATSSMGEVVAGRTRPRASTSAPTKSRPRRCPRPAPTAPPAASCPPRARPADLAAEAVLQNGGPGPDRRGRRCTAPRAPSGYRRAAGCRTPPQPPLPPSSATPPRL